MSVETDDTGKRLDAYLADKIHGFSRSRLQKAVADGDVLVNEKTAKASYKVRGGDSIEVEIPDSIGDDFEAEDIPIEIVYEDEFLAVINKPAGIVVHPGAGVKGGTLANAVAFHFGFGNSDFGLDRSSAEEDDGDKSVDTSDPKTTPKSEKRNTATDIRHRVGIVHRLDKDTSGLIVVAKNEEIHEALSEQFRERQVFKQYIALVHGEPEIDRGEVDAPIAREKHNRTKMAVRAHGRHALSLWKVKKRYEKFTLVAVEIKTGRTHQIRVHMAAINHPIVGDDNYNAGRDKTVHNLVIRKAIADLGRFFLHAERLGFTHPKSGEKLEFHVPLPPELLEFLELLGESY